jgi:hypothetical protein
MAIRRLVMSAAALMGMGLAGAAAAQETEFKNDSLQDGDTAAIQAGFVDGEIGAATFVVPQDMWPIQVYRVQFFWKSLLGDPGDISVQDAILIYAGKGPNQLHPVFESAPPQLTDGYLNEFDLTVDQIIINKPENNSAFTVGLRFSDAPDGDPTKPSLVTDTNGCQPGLNPLYAIPGGWKDLCQFGASGDFVIRAIVGPPLGDQCLPDLDGNGVLDLFDFLAFTNLFNAGDPGADLDDDGFLDLFDFLAFNNMFNAGC